MTLDPRLQDPSLLALAAFRLQQRQQAEPRRTVSLKVVYYDALGIEPLLEGPTYTYDESELAWRADDGT
jgi:hypothetical protein